MRNNWDRNAAARASRPVTLGRSLRRGWLPLATRLLYTAVCSSAIFCIFVSASASRQKGNVFLAGDAPL